MENFWSLEEEEDLLPQQQQQQQQQQQPTNPSRPKNITQTKEGVIPLAEQRRSNSITRKTLNQNAQNFTDFGSWKKQTVQDPNFADYIKESYLNKSEISEETKKRIKKQDRIKQIIGSIVDVASMAVDVVSAVNSQPVNPKNSSFLKKIVEQQNKRDIENQNLTNAEKTKKNEYAKYLADRELEQLKAYNREKDIHVRNSYNEQKEELIVKEKEDFDKREAIKAQIQASKASTTKNYAIKNGSSSKEKQKVMGDKFEYCDVSDTVLGQLVAEYESSKSIPRDHNTSKYNTSQLIGWYSKDPDFRKFIDSYLGRSNVPKKELKNNIKSKNIPY